jgi:hypothetical protein
MRAIIVALLLCAAAPAVADSHSRSIARIMPGCLEAISPPPRYSELGISCIAYIAGFSGVLTSNLLAWPVCPPPDTTTDDVIRAFVDWANRNRDVWHEHEFRGLMAAVTERWPCPK